MVKEKDTGELTDELVQNESENKTENKTTEQEAADSSSPEEEKVQDEIAEDDNADTESSVEQENVPETEEKKENAEEVQDVKDQDPVESVEADAAEKKPRRGRPPKVKTVESMFDKRRVHAADAETRKELYKEPESIVPTLNPGPVITESTQRRAEYNYLMQAARSVPPKILTGEITGVDKTENMNTWVAHVNVTDEIMENGYFDIIIPASHLIPGISDKITEAESEELGRIMTARLGAVIDFIIYDVDEENQLAVASRLKAMEMVSHINYTRLRKDDLPNIFEGKIVQARITEVREFGLSIEASGAECFVLPKELSYTTLSSITDEFEVGQVVNAKILSIKDKEVTVNNQKFRLKEIEASVKQAGRNPQEVFINRYREGGTYSGVIKRVTEKGIFVVIDNKVDCLCFVPHFGTPERGKRCTVIIDKVDTDSNQISGRILRIAK